MAQHDFVAEFKSINELVHIWLCRLWRLAVAFGVWRLAFGVWRLAFGVWRLAFGIWPLAVGRPMPFAFVSASRLGIG